MSYKEKIKVRSRMVTQSYTITRQLEPSEFHCANCNKIHKKSAYALAQAVMNIRLVFTCECGNKIDI